jgi:SAM-dependent methyltransferase
MNTEYSESFYDAMTDSNLASARAVVPQVLDLIGRVTSVVDVGCGRGLWLKAFLENGITDIFGVDGDWVNPQDLSIDPSSFQSVDLEKPLLLQRTFDLAISLEVAEHLSPEKADMFVKGITTLAPVILFSAAIPGQGGTDHRNEQWPAYWIQLFSHHGYTPIDAVRSRVWSNKKVAFFYAQNCLLFVKNSELNRFPQLAEMAKNAVAVPHYVHPTLFERVHEDATRWKMVAPYIGMLPLPLIKKFKYFLRR